MPPSFYEHILVDHQEELRRFILRKVNCPDATQDIFQDTYLRYAHYPDKSQIQNHRAFIFKIAANLVTDHIRQNGVRERHHAEDPDAIDSVFFPENRQPEQLASQQERLRHWAQAVMELPPRCREVFILVKFKELTHPQVARQMGISVSMVDKHLSHALKVLQQQKFE
jgi:RNA polymerase sigma factor (sigma-70 family)